MYVLTRLLTCVSLCIGLSACTQILSATHEGPIEDDPGSRSLGSYIDDQIIETKVSVNIRKANDAFPQASIDVNSHNGIVLLTGQVPNEELKRVAAAVADQVKKVRKVHNELVIGEPIHLMARTSDSWLATKVKSRLSLNDELDASRIKVITENGAVYLMGLVSKNESDIAAKVASETTGVQKVIRVFEYY